MSSSFFFISAFIALGSLGLCPSSMMICSKDFILLSLAREDTFPTLIEQMYCLVNSAITELVWLYLLEWNRPFHRFVCAAQPGPKGECLWQ